MYISDFRLENGSMTEILDKIGCILRKYTHTLAGFSRSVKPVADRGCDWVPDDRDQIPVARALFNGTR